MALSTYLLWCRLPFLLLDWREEPRCFRLPDPPLAAGFAILLLAPLILLLAFSASLGITPLIISALPLLILEVLLFGL